MALLSIIQCLYVSCCAGKWPSCHSSTRFTLPQYLCENLFGNSIAAWLLISEKRLINYQFYWSSIALNKNLKGIGFKGRVHEKNHPLATHHNVRSLWWHFLNHTTQPTLGVTKGQTSTQYKCNMAKVSDTNKQQPIGTPSIHNLELGSPKNPYHMRVYTVMLTWDLFFSQDKLDNHIF